MAKLRLGFGRQAASLMAARAVVVVAVAAAAAVRVLLLLLLLLLLVLLLLLRGFLPLPSPLLVTLTGMRKRPRELILLRQLKTHSIPEHLVRKRSWYCSVVVMHAGQNPPRRQS